MKNNFVFSLAVFLFLCPLTARAIESVTISQVTQLQFGALSKPAAGSQTYTIPANGGAATGTGTLLFGTVMRGQYTLKAKGTGGGFTSYTIDIQNIVSGNANLTINAFTGDYNGTAIASFPRTGLPKASVAGTTLYLGATASYNSSIPIATIAPSFDIVVTLQ